jgi:DNA-binding CsgD family transcriptional regulator
MGLGGTRRTHPRTLAPALAARVKEAIAAVLGERELAPNSEEPLELWLADELLELAFEVAAHGLASERALPYRRLRELARALDQLMRVRREVNASALEARRTALAGAHDALARLRGIASVEQVCVQGLTQLCHSGDFDRAILYAVDGGYLTLRHLVTPDGPSDPATVTHQGPIPATGPAAEALRRRVPMLVIDGAQECAPSCELTSLAENHGFALAPVIPDDKVVALVHADRAISARPLDGLDRDTLWTFAEGFGYALERAALIDRLRAQQARFHRLAATGEEAMAGLAALPVSVFALAAVDPAPRQPFMFTHDEPRDELLSAREREILALMSEGARNRDIASRLCISEETVKSHVRRILRKLRAGNRTEAVSRYHRLAARVTPQSEPSRG